MGRRDGEAGGTLGPDREGIWDISHLGVLSQQDKVPTQAQPLLPPLHPAPLEEQRPPLPFPVDVWQRLLGRVSQLPVELGEVQLLRLQVPGGTTRGRGRVRNERQGRSRLLAEQAGG